MPRLPRKKSNTGIYHIMLRGINRQSLFEDDQDRRKFLEILKSRQEESRELEENKKHTERKEQLENQEHAENKEGEQIKLYDIYAWVLMGNHVHLVMRFFNNDSMQYVMKGICVAYAYYFNHKNARIGPVFQDRYNSQPIETERYLINAVRYVHMNPVKAEIAENPVDYIWSSYNEYMHKKSIAHIIDTTSIHDIETAIIQKTEANEIDTSDFDDLHETPAIETDSMQADSEVFAEMSQERRKSISDDAAREIMKMFGCRSIEDFREFGHDAKKECIRTMHSNGASITQLSRVTGITRPTIYKMLLQRDGSSVKP